MGASPFPLFAGFNLNIEPFDNKKVRQALNYAVDNESIVNNILEGVVRISTSPTLYEVFGYSS